MNESFKLYSSLRRITPTLTTMAPIQFTLPGRTRAPAEVPDENLLDGDARSAV